jgi:hypothetical protein
MLGNVSYMFAGHAMHVWEEGMAITIWACQPTRAPEVAGLVPSPRGTKSSAAAGRVVVSTVAIGTRP